MLLLQHHEMAREIQRIEGDVGLVVPATPRGWRWLPARRRRIEGDAAGTGMPMYDPYR